MIAPPFADLHHHVLWGVDDGPQAAEEMHAQLKMAHEDGISAIAATCHAYPRIQPFDMARYQQRLAEANAYCQDMGWPLQVLPGCEIRYSARVPDMLRAGELLTLNGTRYVLVEFAEDFSFQEITRAANRLYQAGYWPIVAHVERCRSLVRAPQKAIDARDDLCLMYQMNCDTLLDPHGFFEKRFVRKLLDARAIDLIATDAHNQTTRPIRLGDAYRSLEKRDPKLAQRLLERSWQVIGKT